MTTGGKIAALRKEQGMSQEALGEKLGLSRQAVSKWEADQAVPTMDNLMELSKLFGVPVDTLLRPDAELMPKAEDSDESWPGAENQPVRNEKPQVENCGNRSGRAAVRQRCVQRGQPLARDRHAAADRHAADAERAEYDLLSG